MSKNRLIFVIDSDDPRQLWSENADQAMEEFFAEHRKWQQSRDRYLSDPQARSEQINKEPGNGPDHALRHLMGFACGGITHRCQMI